jgi:hypothetical protein
MLYRYELLNKIARLGRLSEDQLRSLAVEWDQRITRMLSRKRRYVYVAVVIPLTSEGYARIHEITKHVAMYEAKKESVVYRAGQEKFGLMNTNEQVFFDTVVTIEE